MRVSFRKLAIGTLVAGAAGYVAGILTAPKSGKETRKDLKDVADARMADAEKQLKKLHTELTDLIGQAKDSSNKARGKAKDQAQDLADKAGVAKQKVRELISAIHEGEADNKDLQRAMDDAQKAIKHLRDYLKK